MSLSEKLSRIQTTLKAPRICITNLESTNTEMRRAFVRR